MWYKWFEKNRNLSANLDEEAVSRLPPDFPCGVFYGLARVDCGRIHGMIMSIGWNPQFQNEKKTIVSIFKVCSNLNLIFVWLIWVITARSFFYEIFNQKFFPTNRNIAWLIAFWKFLVYEFNFLWASQFFIKVFRKSIFYTVLKKAFMVRIYRESLLAICDLWHHLIP